MVIRRGRRGRSVRRSFRPLRGIPFGKLPDPAALHARLVRLNLKGALASLQRAGTDPRLLCCRSNLLGRSWTASQLGPQEVGRFIVLGPFLVIERPGEEVGA